MTERFSPDANRPRTPDFEGVRGGPANAQSAAHRVEENKRGHSEATPAYVATAIPQADGAP